MVGILKADRLSNESNNFRKKEVEEEEEE